MNPRVPVPRRRSCHRQPGALGNVTDRNGGRLLPDLRMCDDVAPGKPARLHETRHAAFNHPAIVTHDTPPETVLPENRRYPFLTGILAQPVGKEHVVPITHLKFHRKPYKLRRHTRKREQETKKTKQS